MHPVLTEHVLQVRLSPPDYRDLADDPADLEATTEAVAEAVERALAAVEAAVAQVAPGATVVWRPADMLAGAPPSW